jgi:intracellular multiplication protein IcmN
VPIKKIKTIKTLVMLAIVQALVACHSQPNAPTFDDDALPKKVKGASDKEIITIQRQLNKQNIKVISMGQNYLISIPSDKIFADESPRLTWASYQILNEVIKYLKQFRAVSIHIRAFSSQYVSARREQALTATRAKAVGDYIQSQDVDARFIFTSGLGSDKPIMTPRKAGDLSGNSRVEITFRRQVA